MKALRILACTLLLLASAHSVGLGVFRGLVGGVGLLITTAMTRTEEEKAKRSDEIDRDWDARVETAKKNLAVELALGVGFGVLFVAELASAILVAVGKRPPFVIATCVFALALVGARMSLLPGEGERHVRLHPDEAAAWYGPATSRGPLHYLPSVVHLGAALVGALAWWSARRPAPAPLDLG